MESLCHGPSGTLQHGLRTPSDLHGVQWTAPAHLYSAPKMSVMMMMASLLSSGPT